jgi:mitogen-activated protein kinase kinase kinase 4
MIVFSLCPLGNRLAYILGLTISRLSADSASKQGPIEAIQKSVRLFEERRYREMRRKNIIGQVCDTPKSYDNVMHVGLRKVTFKWQRGNKIGEDAKGSLSQK